MDDQNKDKQPQGPFHKRDTQPAAQPSTTPSSQRDERDQRPPYTYQPEPDRPLNPHGFGPRLEKLANYKTPRILISPEAYKRMQLYVELARKEVGWLGTCTRLENGDFFIDATFLLEQEVTATETELSVEGQNKLTNELVMRGEDGIEQVNRMRFWGHSHVRMGTSPSGTDERTMERWQSEGLPWAIRGIFNKLGRAEFTLYLYDQGIRIWDTPWAVMDPATNKILLEKRSYENRGYVYGGGYRNSGGYGGGTPWYRRPYNEERPSWWGGGSQPAREDSGVPKELQADEALRNEVTAEFAAKVSERLLILSGWFDKQGRDSEWAPRPDEPTGDGAPAGTQAPGSAQNTTQQPQPAGEGWSFWRWLAELFDSRPNSTARGGTQEQRNQPLPGDNKPPHDGSDTQ